MRLLGILLLAVMPVRCVYAGALDETRYCGTPKRDANGQIVRSRAVTDAFRRFHPCPVTGLIDGSCTGWQINHVIPLACGGCDSVSNLDWMPVEIKTCTAWYCRDRFERKIYGAGIPGTDTCSTPPIH